MAKNCKENNKKAQSAQDAMNKTQSSNQTQSHQTQSHQTQSSQTHSGMKDHCGGSNSTSHNSHNG